jgi:hypothetical protein
MYALTIHILAQNCRQLNPIHNVLNIAKLTFVMGAAALRDLVLKSGSHHQAGIDKMEE